MPVRQARQGRQNLACFRYPPTTTPITPMSSEWILNCFKFIGFSVLSTNGVYPTVTKDTPACGEFAPACSPSLVPATKTDTIHYTGCHTNPGNRIAGPIPNPQK